MWDCHVAYMYVEMYKEKKIISRPEDIEILIGILAVLRRIIHVDYRID